MLRFVVMIFVRRLKNKLNVYILENLTVPHRIKSPD